MVGGIYNLVLLPEVCFLHGKSMTSPNIGWMITEITYTIYYSTYDIFEAFDKYPAILLINFTPTRSL